MLPPHAAYKNMHRSSNSLKWRRLTGWALAVFVLGIAGCLRHKVHLVDQQMSRAYESYRRDSFEVVTNALREYIRFLEAQPPEVFRSRDIFYLSYLAHAKLAYMLLCSADEQGAGLELDRAYSSYRRVQSKDNLEPLAKSEFVDYIINGVERVDARTGVAWRSRHAIDTNTVAKVKQRFVSQRDGP
jgi:hypothetical protein